MNNLRIKKTCAAVFTALLTVLSALFFSCQAGTQTQIETENNSPLETVLRLKEENKHFENNQSRSTASHAPEVKAILDRGYVVFAMTAADQKPFFYREEQTGELIGLDVEIGYAIANRLGVTALFNRNAASFDGVVAIVLNKEADIALSKLSLTIRRAELVRFTRPYITFRQALLINRMEFAKVGTEEMLPQYIRNYQGSLGVITNSSYMNYALTNFPDADIRTFDTWDQTVDALFDGKVMGIYRDEGEILIVNTKRKDTSILMKPVFINDKRDPIAMAVCADAPLLQEWLNVFLEEYLIQNRRQLTPTQLVRRHFGNN